MPGLKLSEYFICLFHVTQALHGPVPRTKHFQARIIWKWLNHVLTQNSRDSSWWILRPTTI